MDDVGRQLKRLGRARARRRGRRALARGYPLFLLLVTALALASRVLGPWPPFDRLEHRWGPALAVGAGLALLPLLLVRLAPLFAREAPRLLARRLDDAQGWGDATDTALSLAPAGAALPVAAFLRAQTVGRLRGLADRAGGSPAGRLGPGWWTVVALLVLVFLTALIGPGVGGWLDRRGAGRGEAAAPGQREEEGEGLDADRWMRDHARLTLARPEADARPGLLRVRLRTDRPLPAALDARLFLDWDGVATADLGPLRVPAGEEARREVDADLFALPALAPHLAPGRHEARARLVPRAGPFEAPVPSNRLDVFLDEGGGGGGGGGEGPPDEPAPEEPPPPKPPPQPPPPTPEPEPPEPESPQPPPPSPLPDGDLPEPPSPPDAPGPVEVVEPFVRDDAETVEKEDAVVAVPHPDAGLVPPPPVPLGEALRALEPFLERTLADERIRPGDRAYLLRYFQALRRLAPAPPEDGGR